MLVKHVYGNTINKLVVFFAGCLISVSAHAVVYSIGTLSATPYINTPPPVTGIFSDRYDFTVASSPSVAATAVTIDLSLGSFGYHITGLNLELFNSSNASQDADTVTGPTDIAVSVSQVLTPGNYYFMVKGTADGASTGKGIYTLSAAAVPEVDTYAMILAGLGLIGFSVHRRKQRYN